MDNHPFRSDSPAEVSADELKKFLTFINHLADESRKVIQPLFRSQLDIDDKDGREYFDPVTEADRNAEEAIRHLIKEHYPDHGIFGEEHGYEEGSSPLTWVIDPIDGTRAFVQGLPMWGTLISLHNGEKSILGLLDQPYLEERFIGAPAINHAEVTTRQGVRSLKTSARKSLEKASMSSTHPSMFKTLAMSTAYADLAKRVRLHTYGGDCYAYAMVALGTHDLVIENSLKPYDIQAIIPLIEAAGGVATAWDGGPADLGGSAIIASTPELHEQALESLRPAIEGGP